MKTEKQQGHITDMTRGDSLKVIIRFALPLVAAAVIQQLFSLTDAMVLGIFSGINVSFTDRKETVGTGDWLCWESVHGLCGSRSVY